ncbi:MAG TPA: ribosome-associated translation inhibitor RaiA [Candidatus Eisenbacteria bacterium]|jgi:putative sigma-54 modulation protein
MQILTTVRHCELDPEVRLHAHQRLEKLGKFARDIREAHLIVTAERYRHSAEITVRLNHHELVSREESNEPRTAIDLAADRLEQQLRRFKEKRVGRKREARGGDRSPEPSAQAESPGEEDFSGED